MGSKKKTKSRSECRRRLVANFKNTTVLSTTTSRAAYSNSDKTCLDDGFLFSIITNDKCAYEPGGDALD